MILQGNGIGSAKLVQSTPPPLPLYLAFQSLSHCIVQEPKK